MMMRIRNRQYFYSISKPVEVEKKKKHLQQQQKKNNNN